MTRIVWRVISIILLRYINLALRQVGFVLLHSFIFSSRISYSISFLILLLILSLSLMFYAFQAYFIKRILANVASLFQ